MSPQGLRFVTVYDRPLDYPAEVVARESWVSAAGEVKGSIVARGATIEEVQRQLEPLGLHWMPRQHGDDPCIVGCWL